MEQNTNGDSSLEDETSSEVSDLCASITITITWLLLIFSCMIMQTGKTIVIVIQVNFFYFKLLSKILHSQFDFRIVKVTCQIPEERTMK